MEDEPRLSFSLRDIWDRMDRIEDKADARLKRLEVVVALVVVYALGEGGAALLAKLT